MENIVDSHSVSWLRILEKLCWNPSCLFQGNAVGNFVVKFGTIGVYTWDPRDNFQRLLE